jgi:uncharacterized protein (DUF433 family)
MQSMAQTFEEIRDAVLHLPTADKARILALVALDVVEAKPGIEFADGVCGGSARILRTRIPVWTLEVARRRGLSDAAILAAFPSLTAEDLANAWNYARSNREEMDREILANGDEG